MLFMLGMCVCQALAPLSHFRAANAVVLLANVAAIVCRQRRQRVAFYNFVCAWGLCGIVEEYTIRFSLCISARSFGTHRTH